MITFLKDSLTELFICLFIYYLFINCVLCNLSYNILQGFNTTKHIGTNARTSNHDDANGKNAIHSNPLKGSGIL